MQLADWSTETSAGAGQEIISKWIGGTTGNNSWTCQLLVDGQLQLWWSPLGTGGAGDFFSIASTSAGRVPMANADRAWIEIDFTPDNGSLQRVGRFRYALDDTDEHTEVVGWQTLATVTQAGATTIGPSATDVTIAGRNPPSFIEPPAGGIFRAVAMTVAGLEVLNVKFTDPAQGWSPGDTNAATGVDATGKTVTLVSNVRILRTIEIFGDWEMRWFGRPDSFATGVDQYIASMYEGTGGRTSWYTRIRTAGQLNAVFRVLNGPVPGSGGDLVSLASHTDAVGLKITRVAATGVTQASKTVDGVTWTAIGPPLVIGAGLPLDLVNSPIVDLEVGAIDGSVPPVNSGTLIGVHHRFELRDGIGGPIVASPDFTKLTPGTTSFVDDQGNTWPVTAPGIVESTIDATITVPAAGTGPAPSTGTGAPVRLVSASGASSSSTAGTATAATVHPAAATSASATAAGGTAQRTVAATATGPAASDGQAVGEGVVPAAGNGTTPTAGAATALRSIDAAATAPTTTPAVATAVRRALAVAASLTITAGTGITVRTIDVDATGTAATAAAADATRTIVAYATGITLSGGAAVEGRIPDPNARRITHRDPTTATIHRDRRTAIIHREPR